jgi:hypothetical protein
MAHLNSLRVLCLTLLRKRLSRGFMGLSIEDIRNPARQSGFEHVNRIGGANQSDKQWRASWRTSATVNTDRGTSRRIPEEAAQDYCDHVNGGQIAYAVLKRVAKTDRPEKPRREISEREKRLRRELRMELSSNPASRLHDPLCYLIAESGGAFVKIGYADYSVYSRLDSLQTGNPRELHLIATLPGGQETENKLHAKFIASNVVNEWFTPTREMLKEFGLTRRSFRDRLTRKVCV